MRTLRAPLGRRRCDVRRARRGRRPLPDVQHAARRRHRPRSRPARRRRPRRAGRRRLRLERARRPLPRGQAGAARRSCPRRAGGVEPPRGATARQRAAARRSSAATTSASSRRANAPTLAVWRTDGLELGGADDPVAGLVLSGPHRVDRLFVGGEEVVRDGRLVRADERELAKEHRRQAERFAE